MSTEPNYGDKYKKLRWRPLLCNLCSTNDDIYERRDERYNDVSNRQ